MGMIRDARSVEWVRAGIFGKRRSLDGLGRGTEPGPGIRADEYERLRVLQNDVPVLVDDSRDRRCWWYSGDFYFSDPDLKSEDVHALLTERRLLKEQRLSRARGLAARDRAVDQAMFPVDQIDVHWEEVHMTADMASDSLERYQSRLERIERGDLSPLEPGEDVPDAIHRLREDLKWAQELLSSGGRRY